MKRVVITLIQWYKLVFSPHIPPCCRYYPSCSAYAEEAVEKYGVIRGVFLAGRRLLRCNPFHAGGYDPVPIRLTPGNLPERVQARRTPKKTAAFP